jgi:hypothetical protein
MRKTIMEALNDGAVVRLADRGDDAHSGPSPAAASNHLPAAGDRDGRGSRIGG